MTDSIIQLPPDSTGKKVDTEQLTVGANTVERERNQIAGAAADDIAIVTDTVPGASDHGLVVRIAPGSAAADIGKARDAPAGAADTGVMALAVRRDADTSPVGADGDYQPLVANAAGALKVEIFDGGDSHTIDNADLATIAGAVTGSEMQVDVITLPALVSGDAQIGHVGLSAGEVWNEVGGAVATVKYAAINVAGAGDNTIVAAVAGKKITVLAVTLVAGAAVNVRFEDGAAGTALTGIMELAANGGFSNQSIHGLFQTSDNTLLNLELSAAVNVDGFITYVELD